MKLNNFSEYYRSINESSKYGKKIRSNWSDGYDFEVFDRLEPSRNLDPDYINLVRETPKAYGFCFVTPSDKESRILYLPKAFLKVRDKSNVTKVFSISGYSNFFKEKKDELEDFFNDYYESLENRGRDLSKELLKDVESDVNILLDILNLEDSVKKVESSGEEFEFNGITDDGYYFECRKKTPDKILGSFKFYKNEDYKKPFLEISSWGFTNPSVVIDAEGIKEEFPVSKDLDMTKIFDDTYLNFLFKKSIGKETKEDEDSLVEYYKKLLGRRDLNIGYTEDPSVWKAEENLIKKIEKVEKALFLFMPNNKIEEIRKSFSK